MRWEKAAAALAVATLTMGTAFADTVLESLDPVGDNPLSHDISARTRWAFGGGNRTFEGILFTPTLDPQINTSLLWNESTMYAFDFYYDALTGTSSWSIDFNDDGFFTNTAGNTETVSETTAALAGYSFEYVTLVLDGRNGSISTQDFTINGFNFGDYSETGTANFAAGVFYDSSGLFEDIHVTGTVSMDGILGTSSELPRMWIQLGNAQELAVVPVPPAAAIGLLGIALVAVRRRFTRFA